LASDENIHVKKKIVIVGAGLAGLLCAKILSENGLKVIILERQKMIGGLASGIKERGFSMDIGPHYMVLPKKSFITKEIQNLLGEGNLLEFPNFIQSHKAYFSGKILDHFPSLKKVVTGFGINFILRVIFQVSLLSLKRIFKKDNSTTGQKYLKNNYGELLYKHWFSPYYTNIFLEKDLPKEFVKKRFPPPSLKKILSFSFSINSKLNNIKNSDENQEYFNCYPKFGMIDLIEKIKNQILLNGGEIILDVDIQSITHEKNKKIVYLKDKNEFELYSNIIIYGIPPSITLRWFENVPHDVLTHAKKSSAYDSIMIYFFINSENIFDGWIINIFEPGFIFSRISQQNYLSTNIAPEGKSLLTIEIKCNSNDEIWKLDDDKISKLVKTDLEKMNFFNCQKIYGYKIIKIPSLYPKFDTTEFNDQKLVDFINSFENEYALSHEFDSSELISETGVDSQERKEYRLGGILIAISSAYSLVKKILKD